MVLVRWPTDWTEPRRVRPVAWSAIVTVMPGLTSPASLGGSWPATAGSPMDRVTSEPLASCPTGPATLTTRAGNRGTNMISASGTIGVAAAFLPPVPALAGAVGTGYPSAV